MARRLRPFACATVWLACLAGAVWLYLENGGPAEAVAIAETRVYRVSAAQLGRLTALDVVEGQRVSAGQVIARLETQLLEKEIAVARAGVRHAASEWKAKDATLETERMQIERSFETEIQDAEVALQAAQADQSRDRTGLAKLHEEVEREHALRRRGLVKAERLTQLEIQCAALEETVRAWPARISAVESRRRSASARLESWRAAFTRQDRGTRMAQLLPVRDSIDRQEQSLDLLKVKLGGTVLQATATAYVTTIHARPGDVIRAGDPVVTLVETRPRLVVAYVDERRGMSLSAGAKVVARRRNAPSRSVEGTVAAVGGDVAALPQRLWTNPHVPAWGRAVYIDVPAESTLDPGEILDIRRAPSAAAPTLLSRLMRQ
jgi:multidrug resistance efflux pump